MPTLLVTARHCTVTEPVRARAAKKVDKFVTYMPTMTGAHLIVTREKSRYEAELVVTARHLRLVGKAEAMDPATAVDEAVERVTHQLRKQHARRQDLHLRQAHAWATIRKSPRGRALPDIVEETGT